MPIALFKLKRLHKQAKKTQCYYYNRISREMGVERFIHVSYLNQGPNPQPLVLKKPSNYKISKHWGECAVREEFPTATIIRASDIYGSEDRFLRYLDYDFDLCATKTHQILLLWAVLLDNSHLFLRLPRWSSGCKHDSSARDPGCNSKVRQSVIEFSIRNFSVTVTESEFIPGGCQ